MDSPAAVPPTLIVGLGFTGVRLATALAARGVRVRGTVRSPQKAAGLALEGVEVVRADLARPETLAGLAFPDGAIVHTAPPVVQAGADLGARHLLEACRETRPRALVYLSTTGVYAERDGGWVDENAPVDATTPRAAPRLDAERAFLESARGLGATGIVFRVSGIYGPGRGLARRLQEGRVRLWGGGGNYLNRIHVDDIVRFVIAALQAPPTLSGIYNLADDRPATLREYATWLAARLDVPLPPEAPLDEAPPTLAGSKRIANRKAMETFGLELLHPTFVEGVET